jgi:hypothetical protein
VKQSERRIGCLVFGIVWAALFIVVIGFANMGDCAEPDYAQCESRRDVINNVLVGIAVVGIVVVGWIFYRAEMKDSDF